MRGTGDGKRWNDVARLGQQYVAEAEKACVHELTLRLWKRSVLTAARRR